MTGKPKDLTGKKFGKLVVLQLSTRDRWGAAVWFCLCLCGNKIFLTTTKVTNNKFPSCDQCRVNQRREAGLLHTLSPHYDRWKLMMRRCYETTFGNYKKYGAKGITVCMEWHDFQNFRKWADEHGLEKGLQIDRIDSRGDYCPREL